MTRSNATVSTWEGYLLKSSLQRSKDK